MLGGDRAIKYSYSLQTSCSLSLLFGIFVIMVARVEVFVTSCRLQSLLNQNCQVDCWKPLFSLIEEQGPTCLETTPCYFSILAQFLLGFMFWIIDSAHPDLSTFHFCEAGTNSQKGTLSTEFRNFQLLQMLPFRTEVHFLLWGTTWFFISEWMLG